ncbi:hypothetical protein ABIE78_005050 [Sinorhizobium fredii]
MLIEPVTVASTPVPDPLSAWARLMSKGFASGTEVAALAAGALPTFAEAMTVTIGGFSGRREPCAHTFFSAEALIAATFTSMSLSVPGDAIGAALLAAIMGRRELPQRVAVPVAHRKDVANVWLVAGIPERQAGEQPVLGAAGGDLFCGDVVGVEDRVAPGAGLDVAGKNRGVLERHVVRGIDALDVEDHQFVLARFRIVEEVIGLVDRIARSRQVVGAP